MALVVGEREAHAKRLREERAREYQEYLRNGGGGRRRRRTDVDDVPPQAPAPMMAPQRPEPTRGNGTARFVEPPQAMGAPARTSGVGFAPQPQGDGWDDGARAGGAQDLLDELRRGRVGVRFREPADSFDLGALAMSPPAFRAADKLDYLSRLEDRAPAPSQPQYGAPQSYGGPSQYAQQPQLQQYAPQQPQPQYPPPQQQYAPQGAYPPQFRGAPQNAQPQHAGVGLPGHGQGGGAAADKKEAYRRELEEQVRMKNAQKQQQRAEAARYDQIKQAEIAAYNPFGRAGAGAPHRDASGNIVSNLKAIHMANVAGAPVSVPQPLFDPAAAQSALAATRFDSFGAGGASAYGAFPQAGGAAPQWQNAPGDYGRSVPPLAVPTGYGTAPQQGCYDQPHSQAPADPWGAAPGGGVGGAPEDKKEAYRRELEAQVRMKNAQKMQQKAEAMRYEQMKDAEIAAYNPFGRAGAGAPHRDASGNIVSNLKAIHMANVAGANVSAPQPLFPGFGATQNPAGGAPQFAGGPPQAQAPAPQGYQGGYGAPPPPQGVFSPPRPEAAAARAGQQLSYQEELRRQVEEKEAAKRREQEKLREEEARENARLQKEREELQRQYEREQEERRQKEENQRKQQEELARQRAEAEQRALEEKRRKHEARRAAADPPPPPAPAHRSASPPIPTMRSQSPPIPTMRNNTHSPPIPTMRDRAGTPQRPASKGAPREVSPPPVVRGRGSRAGSRTSSPAPPAHTHAHSHAHHAHHGGGNDPEEATRKVMDQLSAMRKQLQTEQKRLESQMARSQESYSQLQARHPAGKPPRPEHGESVGADAFGIALPRRAAPAASSYVPADEHRDLDIMDILLPTRRGPSPSGADLAREFDALKYRDTGASTRRRVMEKYPEPPRSGDALDAQQRAVLREQAREIGTMRNSHARAAPSTMSVGDDGRHTRTSLNAESRFVTAADSALDLDGPGRGGASHGRRAARNAGPQPTVSSSVRAPSPGAQSTASFNLEAVSRKNEERLRRLEALVAPSSSVTVAPSAISGTEPLDVLDQFMRKGRPASGRSQRSLNADTYQLMTGSKRSVV